MSNWQTERAERNKRSFARLSKNLPEIFPPAVLTRALSRPFIPPTPRLAVDSYWHAHPIRADRLARSLAARTGSLNGWKWQLASNRKSGYRSHSERPQRDIESVPTHADLDSAASADSLFIALDGTLICGTPAPIKTRPGTAPA
jgi:hypothetical protein